MQNIEAFRQTIPSFDSTELYYAKDLPQHFNAVILLLHGFSEHLGRYEPIKDILIAYGYAVYRYDIRGHGLSGGKRGYIKDYNHFIQDTDVIVNLIKNEVKGVPLFMMGYSMGAFIAATYAINYGHKVSGQILLSAATMKLSLQRRLIGHACRGITFFYSDLKITNAFINRLLRKESDFQHNTVDDLGLQAATLKLHIEFLMKGNTWLHQHLDDYKLPCLLLHGKHDKVVPHQSAKDFHQSIGSQDKRIKIYEDLTHDIFHKDYRDHVMTDIQDWILERL